MDPTWTHFSMTRDRNRLGDTTLLNGNLEVGSAEEVGGVAIIKVCGHFLDPARLASLVDETVTRADSSTGSLLEILQAKLDAAAVTLCQVEQPQP